MEFVKPVLSPLPLLLFTTALGLYTTVRVLDRCCESVSAAFPLNACTDTFGTTEDSKPTIEGQGPDQVGVLPDFDSLANNTGGSDTRRFETDFADVEIIARKFSTRLDELRNGSTQESFEKEELEILLAELQQRLGDSQPMIIFSRESFDIPHLNEPSEQTCPCTPRLGFDGYISSPDSGYYSHASPRSVVEATSPARDVKNSAYGGSVDVQDEMVEIGSELELWTKCGRARKSSSESAIFLSRFVNNGGTGMFFDLSVTVLDRESQQYVPLSTALATKDLRRRTGLLLSLFNISEDRELRIREAIAVDQLDSVKAIILIWDREDKTFKNLTMMLMGPQTRLHASLCIERRSRRSDKAALPERPASWHNLVASLDLDEFYLGQLYTKGLNVHSQVEL